MTKKTVTSISVAELSFKTCFGGAVSEIKMSHNTCNTYLGYDSTYNEISYLISFTGSLWSFTQGDMNNKLAIISLLLVVYDHLLRVIWTIN